MVNIVDDYIHIQNTPRVAGVLSEKDGGIPRRVVKNGFHSKKKISFRCESTNTFSKSKTVLAQLH